MKRHLKKFRFGPAIFLQNLPRFITLYFRSRSKWLLLWCLSLLAASIFLWPTLLDFSSGKYTDELLDHYQDALKQAVSDHHFEDADLFFDRCRQLADDPVANTFEYAAALYSLSPADSPQRKRALSLMQSIAPRRREAPGSTDAHLFLADYWRNEADVSHVSTVLSLHHLACAEPDNPVHARKLADCVLSLGYRDHAISFLRPFSNDAENLILLSRCHLQKGNQKAAAAALDEAIDLQRKNLSVAASNRRLRIRLSQTLSARGLPMQSFFVLAAGFDQDPDAVLSDHLVQRYIMWLKQLDTKERSSQLKQIALALRIPESSLVTDGDQRATGTIRVSSGDTVSLPLAVVRFHEALTSEDHLWLVPLLRASEELQRDRTDEAIRLLRSTLAIVPDHPVALNNLAYVLYQLNQPSDSKPSPTTSDRLSEALDLATRAISADSDNPAYRQTRAVIAVDLQDWTTAVEDLRFCLDANYRFSETLPLLKRAEAQKQKLEAR